MLVMSQSLEARGSYPAGSDELTQYLNNQIMKKCPKLKNYLLEKIKTDRKSPNQVNDLLIKKLQEDENINFEALINE